MTRKRNHRPPGPDRPPAPDRPKSAPPSAPDDDDKGLGEEEREPTVPEMAQLALDRLAKVMDPEAFLALQDTIPQHDPRWLNLFAHAFDEQGELSPLLAVKPVSLRPVVFEIDGQRGGAGWLVDTLVAAFAEFPEHVGRWQAAISYRVIHALGETRCVVLGRGGMGDVVGAVETALTTRASQVPLSLSPQPIPLDAARLEAEVENAFPLALARSRLGSTLQRAFPNEDDDELDTLITEATGALEVRAGPPPEFNVEVRAGDRPWLPLQNVADALKRKLGGGLRVLRTL
ncbi:MAG: hypothetical protein AB2A00_32015 [Myxococcota bacterium]